MTPPPDLIEMIYASVDDPSLWPRFLDAFVRAVDAERGGLSLRDVNRDAFAAICWCGWTDEDIASYSRYAPIDPWRAGTGRWPEGAVGTDTDACSRAELEASLAYREFYLPRGAIHGMGGTILVSETGQSVLIVTRGTGPFGEAEKAILRPLMPHLKRAALLHGEIGSLRSQLATFTGHLDRYPHPFLLADLEGRVLYLNTSARELVSLRDGVSIHTGRLSLNGKQDRTLQQVAEEVATGQRDDVRRLEVPRPSGKRAYRVVVMKVPQSGALPLGVALPSVALLIFDPDAGATPDPVMLQDLFHLTPTEARVASELARGRSVEEIAAATGASVGTVRTHLKRIFSKTETSRQGELISVILRSATFGL